MTDEEMLRSAKLILTDPQTGKEGITLAAILLFGSDNLIASVLAHHKTDAIMRVYHVDRCDDRDVIVTNLLDSYDRLIAFGEKHLNDVFTMDGIISVSARDKILREIVSNLLAHRDFSNGYVAKMVIEKDRIFTENANRLHGHGNLNLATFRPFPKNPPISNMFREIGLADELGSGMRNTYKYTRLYSGAEPQFVEGEVFQTIVPLSEAATTVKVGPYVSNDDRGHDRGHDESREEKTARLLEYCMEPGSRNEMQMYLNISSRAYFKRAYLEPLLKEGGLKMTIPEKPQSRNQKYVKV